MEDGRRGGRSWDHQCCRRNWIQVRERKTERVKEDTNYRGGEGVEGCEREVEKVTEPSGISSTVSSLPPYTHTHTHTHTGYSLCNSCLSCGPCARRGSHSASSSSSQPYSSISRESEKGNFCFSYISGSTEG